MPALSLAFSLSSGTAVLLSSIALAQVDLKSRLRPVTGPIQHAGIYHVSTGTWTRDASLSNAAGPDVIYNNSCLMPYYISMGNGERFTHGSRLPSPTGPMTPSVFYGSPRDDERPGCQTEYTIDGFEFMYCSSAASVTLTWLHKFASSWNRNQCLTTEMVPQYSFNLTGLPAGTPTGGQICWIIDVDTSASTPSFKLSADGDGTWISPSTMNQFGWSIGLNTVTGQGTTGPMLAGNFTWTGGGTTGALTPCTGTDGTIWDCPINLSEQGTGMSSNDAYRISGTSFANPGCYYFGGTTVHSDFYLKLFAKTGCPSSCQPMVSYCLPGQGGILSCPCGNPPVSPGLGCDNFGAGPIGGATLSATGLASLAADSLQFTSTGENNTSTSVLLQGTTTFAAGAPYGAGVRCPAGTLKRLYKGSAVGGTITRPGGADPTVHARSAALGDAITGGSTRYYMFYYRDPNAAGPCNDPASTYNSTQSGSVVWYM